MEATLQELSRRVERLENDVHILRSEREVLHYMTPMPKRQLTPEERGALLMESARRNAEYDKWRLGQIFDEMGITSEPISRDDARRLCREAGFDPEANDFAQGIIAMREE
jgi:hypothetical protein